MIIHETTDGDGTVWVVAVYTEVERFWMPGLAVPTADRTFDYDSALKWRNETVAWPTDRNVAHQIVDHVTLHAEPTAD